MKIAVSKNGIYKFLVVTIFFDAYGLFAIGNRTFTLWYLGAIALIVFSIAKPNTLFEGIVKNPFALFMLGYMCFNYFLFGEDVQSFLIGILCWIFYICSYRTTNEKEFAKTVYIFQKGMNIMAIYGIYQSFAYLFGLPFKNPWINGLMVKGYNWGNSITIGGITLQRAHAIFREPSFFSQFLAISILIYLQKLIKNEGNFKRSIKWIIIDSIALALSFSGTGVIMLGVGALIEIISNNGHATCKFIKRHLLFIIAIFSMVILLIVLPNKLRDYFLSRLMEFDPTNVESVSGYLRMVFPYEVAFQVITQRNSLLGLGIGNASKFASGFTLNSGSRLTDYIQPIIPRTIVEEGLIGLVLLILFFIKNVRRENLFSSEYKAILIGTYMMSIMHGTWSSEVYWLLLGLLNLKLVTTDSI